MDYYCHIVYFIAITERYLYKYSSIFSYAFI